MLNFLFWNTKGNDLCDEVREIVMDLGIHVIVLIENSISDITLLGKINTGASTVYNLIDTVKPEFKILTSLPYSSVSKVGDDGRITAKYITTPLNRDYLLVVYHGVDMVNNDEDERNFELVKLNQFIETCEKSRNSKRTIVVGDFNMHPFDRKMVSFDGIHSTHSQEVASREKRKYKNQHKDLFYNPTWNLFRESANSPPGTYYYSQSKNLNYFWYMFDQVLIRPNLIKEFDFSLFKIIGSHKNLKFTTKDFRITKKLKDKYSDHLPLMFSFDDTK